ncbi:unnamed protein product, partial [Didymodactylos carnosus]|jgi:peptidoglycan hydrolase CwlO-like protein
MQRE